MSERKRKRNHYDRLGPVYYSPQYLQWHAAAKRLDDGAMLEADASWRRMIRNKTDNGWLVHPRLIDQVREAAE